MKGLFRSEASSLGTESVFFDNFTLVIRIIMSDLMLWDECHAQLPRTLARLYESCIQYKSVEQKIILWSYIFICCKEGLVPLGNIKEIIALCLQNRNRDLILIFYTFCPGLLTHLSTELFKGGSVITVDLFTMSRELNTNTLISLVYVTEN